MRAMRTTCALAVAGAAASVQFGTSRAAAQDLDLVDLQNVSPTGFFNALAMANAPGDPVTRLFVVEQSGRVRLVSGGTLQAEPVLQLSSVVNWDFERGLLGLAFDPEYTVNRWFYVFYSDRTSGSVVARYVMNPVVEGQPITANPNSAMQVMRIPSTNVLHNGGCIGFGPDGMLHIGVGDAASSERAADPRYLTGKLLRIDVRGDDFPNDAAKNYRIPPDNPAVWPSVVSGRTVAGLPEVWAIGLRNPWRWSFDRLTGDLCIADVGANVWEEVNIVAGNGGPGRNYGWPAFEGPLGQSPSTNPEYNARFVAPVYAYPHVAPPGFPESQTGRAVQGGFVYRGSAIPGWRGRYVFADYLGRVWSLRMVGGVAVDVVVHTAQLANLGSLQSIYSLGEDNDGELYIVSPGGPVRKIVPSALSNSLSLADVAQCNGLPGPDGNVDGFDFVAFINAYVAGDTVADVVGADGSRPADGAVDALDFVAFVSAFADGA